MVSLCLYYTTSGCVKYSKNVTRPYIKVSGEVVMVIVGLSNHNGHRFMGLSRDAHSLQQEVCVTPYGVYWGSQDFVLKTGGEAAESPLKHFSLQYTAELLFCAPDGCDGCCEYRRVPPCVCVCVACVCVCVLSAAVSATVYCSVV